VPTTRRVNGSWHIRYTSRLHRNGNITCQCDRSNFCARPQGFYCQSAACKSNTATPNSTVPGLSIGCLPVDSILQSTLECFYNQSCIDTLINWRLFDFESIFLPVNLTGITALDGQQVDQFLPNTKLETIISNLFVEHWTKQADFGAYYDRCQPESCTYTFIERYEWVFIVTSIIGFMGGISVVLRLIVPLAVTALRRVYHHRRRRNLGQSGRKRSESNSFTDEIRVFRCRVKCNLTDRPYSNIQCLQEGKQSYESIARHSHLRLPAGSLDRHNYDFRCISTANTRVHG
jgi:hypothetical protein